MFILDFGIGRIEANQINTPEWDRWAKRMFDKGILIKVLLPNSTAVTALMDHLFGPYKNWTRERQQVVFAEHIQAHSDMIVKIKADMAAGIEVSAEDKKKLTTVVRMEPEDVGKIVYGKLDENKLPHPDSPIARAFTKPKIKEGAFKVSLVFVMLHCFLTHLLTCVILS
jgi:hypothetical protein